MFKVQRPGSSEHDLPDSADQRGRSPERRWIVHIDRRLHPELHDLHHRLRGKPGD